MSPGHLLLATHQHSLTSKLLAPKCQRQIRIHARPLPPTGVTAYGNRPDSEDFTLKFFLIGLAYKPTREAQEENRACCKWTHFIYLLYMLHVETNAWKRTKQILFKRNFQVMLNAFIFLIFRGSPWFSFE